MPTLNLSLQDARALMLRAQGLLTPPSAPATKADVLSTIRSLGLLQIDTINIVARSPYLQLFSRLGAYDPAWLDELQVEGAIFEYWAHVACFLPIEHYPYHRRFMLEKMRNPYYFNWYAKNKSEADAILDHVRVNGAVKSSDFERKDGKKGTWWDWKFEKDALEFWFTSGEMMIARREKFQRVYDLRERVYPAWTDDLAPSLEKSIRFFVLQSVRSMGAIRSDWVHDHYRLPKAMVNLAVKELLDSGKIYEVAVEDWREPALVTAETYLFLSNHTLDLIPTYTTLLTPFDPLVCDRARARQMFNFDFTIECYVPAAKRKYGYFLVPLLHRGQIVARMDVKAHRKEGIFEVKGIFWESGVIVDDLMAEEVAQAIQKCAEWHKTPKVVLQRSEPAVSLPL